MEEWRAIPFDGFEGLEVSNEGRVRNPVTGKVYTQCLCSGYRQVSLSAKGARRTFRVHSLVMAAFAGPRPDRMQVNHKDGDKGNNRLTNLEYITAGENVRHAIATGLVDDAQRRAWGRTLGLRNARINEDAVREIRRRAADGETHRVIAADFGIDKASVSDIHRRKSWAWVA